MKNIVFIAAVFLNVSALPDLPQCFAKTIDQSHRLEDVTGIVFEDKNSSGEYDKGDRPLKGVRVSNGRDVAVTDSRGRYRLQIEGDAEIFVIKPRNYRPPLNECNLPQFYYLHRPAGSPKLNFTGIEPTGPPPGSIDFPLIRQKEPDEFNVIVFGDPQPRDIEAVQYVFRDAIEELAAEGVNNKAVFGITLGDIVANNLDMFRPLNAGIAKLGLPWFNVPGNHDSNYDAPHVSQSFETFKKVYGPAYYAFDYGPAHFIVLNTVDWQEDAKGRRSYRPGLGKDQLAFIENDLKFVSKKALTVFLMHIPFTGNWNADERKALFAMFQDRPNTLSFSSHTHSHNNTFLDKSHGWESAVRHHHINQGALCGYHWTGAPDEYGIPPTMMSDGTPNGYGILTVKGSKYLHRYKVLRRPEDFQMQIDAPDCVPAADAASAEVFANVFNAWPHAQVRMRIATDGKWRNMQRKVQPDPVFIAYKTRYNEIDGHFWRDPKAEKNCTHLWTAPLPEKLPAGTHLIEIEALNPDGQVFRGARIIRSE